MKKELAVVTANIRYDEPDDGAQCWDNRKRLLANCILDYQPDLLGSQEGRRRQLDDLSKRLTGLVRIDGHRSWNPQLMYPCLYYNPHRLTPLESGDIWLSETPVKSGSSSFGSEFPRLCTWAKFKENILTINTHLDDVRDETRVEQINVLLREIDELNTERMPVILMGDFNEGPDGRVRKAINAQWPALADPWQRLLLKEESSHHNFDQRIGNGSRVDWILSDSSLQPQEMFLDKTRSEDGIYPSDHFILKARFSFVLPG